MLFFLCNGWHSQRPNSIQSNAMITSSEHSLTSDFTPITKWQLSGRFMHKEPCYAHVITTKVYTHLGRWMLHHSNMQEHSQSDRTVEHMQGIYHTDQMPSSKVRILHAVMQMGQLALPHGRIIIHNIEPVKGLRGITPLPWGWKGQEGVGHMLRHKRRHKTVYKSSVKRGKIPDQMLGDNKRVSL